MISLRAILRFSEGAFAHARGDVLYAFADCEYRRGVDAREWVRDPTSPQDRQDAIDGYREAAKRWRNEMRRHRRSFAEDYSRGAIALFYHLEFPASGVLEDKGTIAAKQPLIDPMLFPMLVFHKKGAKPKCMDLGDQELVFIHVVELVEMVNKLSIPSTVRLYDVEKGICDEDDRLLLFSLTDELYKAFSTNTDRKAFTVPLLGVPLDDLPPSEIKRASEVMQSISEDEGQSIWHGLSRRNLNEIVSGFTVRFDSDVVSTTLEEFSAARIKIRNVLVGPFDL